MKAAADTRHAGPDERPPRTPRVCRVGYVRLRPVLFAPVPRPTIACAGCSVLLRRELLERSGRLLDGRFSHYACDVEAGLRATVVGGLVVQVPTAVVYHVGEEAKRPFDPRLLWRYAAGSRDHILMYWKLMSTTEFMLFLPLLLLGLSLKALELRVQPTRRLLLFAGALAATPLVVAAARRVGRFRLLLAVVTRRPERGRIVRG